MLKIDLNSNRHYMQSAEFWLDKDNRQTTELIDRLMFHRDMLSTVSASSPHDFFQKTDGFVIQKPYKGLKGAIKNVTTYFDKMFTDTLNTNYRISKYALSRQAARVKHELMK